MEAIIDFLKNGVVITFYATLLIFGIFTLYGMLKGIVRVMFKKIFKWRDQMEYLMNGLEFIALMILWALLTIAIFAFSEVFPIILMKCVDKVKEKLNVRDN